MLIWLPRCYIGSPSYSGDLLKNCDNSSICVVAFVSDVGIDLALGSGKACLLVMTERVSRKEVFVELPYKRQESVIEALNRLERKHRGKFAERFRACYGQW